MKINESISPSVFKNLIIVAGLFLVFSIWQAGSKKLAELRYETVYGESFAGSEQQDVVGLESLPIVVAESVSEAGSDKNINDLTIENAFKVPEKAEVDDSIDVISEPKLTVSESFYMTYRPAVYGVSVNGAIINGVYWKVGEKMETMPILLEDGIAAQPYISKVFRDKVVLNVGGETLSLPFERF